MVQHSEESNITVMSGISLKQDDKDITGIGRSLCMCQFWLPVSAT